MVGRQSISRVQPVRNYNVYIWLDGQTPFYIGIGNDQRLKKKSRNKWATNRRKDSEKRKSFRQEVVFIGLRSSCIEIEKFLISHYGTVLNGGTLFNFTEGGDGGCNSDFLHPESRAKLSTNGWKTCKEKGLGFWSPKMEEIRRQNGIISGKKAVSSGQLAEAREKIDFSAMEEDMEYRGRQMGLRNKGKVSITNGEITKQVSPSDPIPQGWRRGDAGGKSKASVKTALTLWKDPDHPEIGHHNAGNLVRRQKSLGLPTGKEHRRKVNGNY